MKNVTKYIFLQTSNTKEIRKNIVNKIFAEIFLWKEKFSPNKNSIKKILPKKNL